jgi:hypothetical protein
MGGVFANCSNFCAKAVMQKNTVKISKVVRFILLKFNLNIQIDFFEPVLAPAIRQRLFYRGQFGLTPVKNIFYSLSCGHKMHLDLHFMS